MFRKIFHSPIGTIDMQATNEGITLLGFVENAEEVFDTSNSILEQACIQLTEYFNGQRIQFEVPLAQSGTAFQKDIWQLLSQIPFGTTTSYHALAQTYGDVKAIRAIASANGKNNIAILVPCHRVIGSNGELTGFAWGLERKRWLLEHEARLSGKTLQARMF
ncbi:methylated-DNA-[protein]-cysteine S-methyltransferase [Cnuella takakiae]|uniref:Methylated-DNA--protein-cysteine methyltransferase n=1 Tax=Cnuella takakiae TaxID=1302690 RepID=A0A1M4UZW9_9BACT|nr:methylated-DNA--[protein]-cysteine S-methyltransferase [Cnuella takakiae]OLY94833.1 hypothetical protein BUE76_13240 [Cnuella takakiae]SHE62274.1 methylated-DNA-[protein]-cysteine S-methyltransferase [Cnuella takakiae]